MTYSSSVGFQNQTMLASNADFSGSLSEPHVNNGLISNGQLWIGSTALNANGTHINVGTFTSPLGTLTIGYLSPNITLDIASGGLAVEHLTGNTGGQLNPTSNNFNTLGTGSITIAGSGSTLTTQLTGLTNHAVQVGAGTATLTQLAVGTNGQVLIGATTADPAFATITSTGGTIAFSLGVNTLNMEVVDAGFKWSETSGAFNAAKSNGYFITTTATATLPATPTEGDTIKFFVDSTNLLTITGNTGQKIRLGTTISAAAGTAVNTQRGDSIELVYMSTGTTWQGVSAVGGWNLT
jgi:hypothetical protein